MSHEEVHYKLTRKSLLSRKLYVPEDSVASHRHPLHDNVHAANTAGQQTFHNGSFQVPDQLLHYPPNNIGHLSKEPYIDIVAEISHVPPRVRSEQSATREEAVITGTYWFLVSTDGGIPYHATNPRLWFTLFVVPIHGPSHERLLLLHLLQVRILIWRWEGMMCIEFPET